MPDAAYPSAVDPLAAGWAALRDARWQQAQTLFTRALADAESAEAFEGASWAAWWLDDERGVLDARERAFRLYRDRGDAPAAARMATWLAADELDFSGAAAVAQGWLARAHRLLDPLRPGPDHGWLAFHEGYLAHADGDTETAVAHGASAAELGRRFGVVDLEMLGLALEGAALVASARVDDGMRRLDEATGAALEEDGAIPIASAWTFCLMVGACTATLDFPRAFAWCDRVAAFAERFGSRYMLAFCRAEYGTLELWRGRYDEAARLLEAAVDDFSHSRPAWVGGPLAGLAELRRREGRTGDASALLDAAGGSSRARLCRARLALDDGRAREAAELLERLLRQIPENRGLDRAPALERLVHARAALGDLSGAADALGELRAVERRVRTTALRACVDLAEGVLLAARGDHTAARPVLEDAVDRFEASGAPLESASARLALSTTLLALGRAAGARSEAAAARDRLHELGARHEARRAQVVLRAATAAPTGGLTPREREVLGMIAEGLTNRQIAARLIVSEHTVHRHVTNILRKLGVPSRAAAAARAAGAGLPV